MHRHISKAKVQLMEIVILLLYELLYSLVPCNLKLKNIFHTEYFL